MGRAQLLFFHRSFPRQVGAVELVEISLTGLTRTILRWRHRCAADVICDFFCDYRSGVVGLNETKRPTIEELDLSKTVSRKLTTPFSITFLIFFVRIRNEQVNGSSPFTSSSFFKDLPDLRLLLHNPILHFSYTSVLSGIKSIQGLRGLLRRV